MMTALGFGIAIATSLALPNESQQLAADFPALASSSQLVELAQAFPHLRTFAFEGKVVIL